MTELPHPAESPEFLSRLHDRELSAAQARDFQAHRAGCAVCREAADEFERSLRAFRASPTAAPASDLSARILRKIREQSPSRRPFGVMFGIDLRWAGVAAAALLIVIIAPALFQRDVERFAPAKSPGASEPLPVYLLEDKTAAAPQASPPKSGQPGKPVLQKELSAAAGPEEAREKTLAGPAPTEMAPQMGVASERDEAAAPRRNASSAPAQPAAPPAATLRSRRQTAAAPGGESGAGAAFADSGRVSVHLVIRAIDGHGEAPELEDTPTEEALAALSGREFVLLVEAAGRVRDVSPSSASGSLLRKDEKAKDRAVAEKKEGSELLALRFAPSDRPRRLLVKVE